MASALEQYKQQWVFSNEHERQRLPRQRSQVLNHLIRRREIGCDSESMDRDSLEEKDGARKKNKSPEICGDTTSKKVTKLFTSSEAVTKSTCSKSPCRSINTCLKAGFREMERDAIQAEETNDGPRNLFSQEAGNVPLLTVYCVCSTWLRFAR